MSETIPPNESKTIGEAPLTDVTHSPIVIEGVSTDVNAPRTATMAPDAVQRINNAIKVYDQRYNRDFLEGDFDKAMDFIGRSGSELIIWMAIQQMIRQVDYMKYVDLVASWVKDMTIKWFVYKYIPKEKQGDLGTLYKYWISFATRKTQDEKVILREFAGKLPLMYHKELEKIWTIDPNETSNLWTKVEAEETKQPKVALP